MVNRNGNDRNNDRHHDDGVLTTINNQGENHEDFDINTV